MLDLTNHLQQSDITTTRIVMTTIIQLKLTTADCHSAILGWDPLLWGTGRRSNYRSQLEISIPDLGCLFRVNGKLGKSQLVLFVSFLWRSMMKT